MNYFNLAVDLAREQATEFVTHQQWDGCARRIVKANLRSQGSSPSEITIARRAKSFIVDIYSDGSGMVVRKGWRQAMREEVTR